jgi:hypothetical protein
MIKLAKSASLIPTRQQHAALSYITPAVNGASSQEGWGKVRDNDLLYDSFSYFMFVRTSK